MKLANYISFRFVGWTALILLISIPVFYFSLEHLMLKNVDEYLENQKIWIENQKGIDLKDIGQYNENVQSESTNISIPETFFNKNIYNKHEDEIIKTRILTYTREQNGNLYKISIHRSLVESEDLIKAIAILQFLLFFLLTILLFNINRNLDRKIWQPFYHMLESLRKYRIDQNSEIPFQDSKIREINTLNQSISDLVERNKKQFLAQKEFTENASHELQTPLAIIQNKVELLMQTEDLPEEKMKIISEIYETNNRLSRLNKSLLLLSKLDNRQFQERKEISLPDLLKQIILDFKEISVAEQLIFKEELETQKTIFADESLIRILLGNIISNTIKYSIPQSEIKITLLEDFLQISNTSTLPKLDENLLFKRFQKQNPSNASTGLGLEISKKICETYGWNLNYRFEFGKHHFTIIF